MDNALSLPAHPYIFSLSKDNRFETESNLKQVYQQSRKIENVLYLKFTYRE